MAQSKPKVPSQTGHPHYCFTINNYNEEVVKNLMNPRKKKVSQRSMVGYLVFGRETAPTTGTKHIQGYLQITSLQGETCKTTIHSVKNWFDSIICSTLFRSGCLTGSAYVRMKGPNGTFIAAHIIPCKGSDDDNYNYCSKDGDVTEWGDRKSIARKKQGCRNDINGMIQMISNGATRDELIHHDAETFAKFQNFFMQFMADNVSKTRIEEMKSDFRQLTFYVWQNTLLQLIDGPVDPRAVYWVWEPTGNVGKSWMAKFLVTCRGAIALEPGRKTDMAYILLQNITKMTTEQQRGTVVIDLSRTMAPAEDDKHSALDVVYAIIEGIKNGFLQSTKYQSMQMWFKPPHVVVFANFPPNTDQETAKLSLDRIKITEITPEMNQPMDEPIGDKVNGLPKRRRAMGGIAQANDDEDVDERDNWARVDEVGPSGINDEILLHEQQIEQEEENLCHEVEQAGGLQLLEEEDQQVDLHCYESLSISDLTNNDDRQGEDSDDDIPILNLASGVGLGSLAAHGARK